MPRRLLVFVLIAVAAAAVCVRLGFWQLSRLAQRRAHNVALAAHLRTAPVGYAALPADTAARHYRRVALAGRPEYAREFVLANRTREGAPGVHVMTPVRVGAGAPGGDTLVLVDRGWLYSANGTDVDLARAREGDSLTVTGYVELPSRRGGAARLGNASGVRGYRAYRFLDASVVARDVGAPVTRDYVVAEPLADETRPPYDRLKRLPTPEVTDEGPHLSYAIQWFSFATVSLVGAGAFVRAERHKRMAQQP
ncbi:SURF1-like protein [Gemmatimonadetes bacterium T265]|nr:SURF1-like protein [Gemmatimonadetes bacterium T265]